MRVKDIIDRDVSSNLIRVTDTFEHLIRILDKVKYHAIFVVDKDDNLVGIVTEGDIIKVLVPKYLSIDESLISVIDSDYFEKKCLERRNLTITEIMTKTTLSIHEDDSLIKAAALMVINRIHTLPVVRDGKVIGIVSRLALIKHITKTLTND